jgi:ferredoxin
MQAANSSAGSPSPTGAVLAIPAGPGNKIYASGAPDVAMAAGLDLPFSCKGGVCATCRCKVMTGSVSMDKNFGLETWETDKGFVLSCQARPTSESVTISFDER